MNNSLIKTQSQLKKVFFKVALTLIFAVFSLLLLAQEKTITGKVISSEDDMGIIGATIVVEGTTIGTVTDFEGNYTLNVPEDAENVVFSFVGMVPKTVAIGTQSEINITLDPDVEELKEVVVTAMAIEREKKELGFSVTTVNAEDLNKAKETNLVNALSGKVAGVSVLSSSGTVGGSSKILIRGSSSLSGDNQPLFVIDGMPVDNSNIAGSNNERISGADVGNRAGDINPEDIENISVLKGPNAAALYGARARDGVIMITTKKGKTGKTSIELSSTYRFENPLVLPNTQSDFAQGSNGEYIHNALNGWGPKTDDVSDIQFPSYDSSETVTLNSYPNNYKNFYQTGYAFINNVSVSGGTEKSSYRLSYGNLSQEGTIPNSILNRNTVNFNSEMRFDNNFTSNVSANYVNLKKEGIPSQGGSVNAFNSILAKLPNTIDINELKDYKNPDGTQKSLGELINNPYWTAYENGLDNKVEKFSGVLNLIYSPFEWLTISERLGTEIYTDYRRQVTKIGTKGVPDGKLDDEEIFYKAFNSTFNVQMNKKFLNDFNIKGLFGHDVNDKSRRMLTNTAQEFEVAEFYDYSNAKSNTPEEIFYQRRLWGLYGNVSLGYKNYAFLEVTGRNDWTSTLPKNNNSYFYPSASLSMILTDAIPSLKSKWLNYAKLRASASQVGSDEDPYQLQFSYISYTQISVPYQNDAPNTPPNNELAYYATTRIPALNLEPQKKNSYEGGIDLDIIDNRVGIDFGYYYEVTKNQIVEIPVSPSTGFSFQNINLGTVANSGVELLVNLTLINKTNFTWSTDVTYTKNVEKVLELEETLDKYQQGSAFSGVYYAAEVGESRGLYALKWQRDSLGRVIIDANNGKRKLENEATRIGDITPKYSMGISNNLRYKNFFLSFLVDIKEGGLIYSGTVQSLRFYGMADETTVNRDEYKTFIDDGVVAVTQPDGSTAYVKNKQEVESMEEFWRNYSASGAESNVFDASYVKLREVRISYKLPDKWMKKFFMKSIEVGLEGRNLWLIKSNVPHIDPEANIFGSGSNAEGLEYFNIPPSRSYGFNFRFTF